MPKLFFENWKKSKYKIPSKDDWYYLYFRIFKHDLYWWWQNRKADFREILRRGLRKADCGKCWFSCKGHTYATKDGITWELKGNRRYRI